VTIKSNLALGGLALVAVLGLAPLSATAAECGSASWYAIRNITANGEMMNPNAMTAAHRTLPFGTVLKVKNQNNGREITVRINDRGPFIKGRIIDLSRAAATRLGFKNDGVTKVCITKS
jgi:rare lipoprotein A